MKKKYDIAEIDDDGYGFSTDVANYELAGHYSQTEEALKADVVMIVEAINLINKRFIEGD